MPRINTYPERTDTANDDVFVTEREETSGNWVTKKLKWSTIVDAVKALPHPTFTVAGLPSAATSTARMVFASDALKVGETTGAGTGTMAYSDGTAWRRVGDDTTVAS